MNFIPLTFYSLSFFMLGVYAYIIFSAIRGLKKIKNVSTSAQADVAIDVIIPYHNERDNLPSLLDSLKNQTHSNFKVIWINDHSTDGSQQYLKENCTIRNSIFSDSQKKGKKAAISHGIEFSNAELIVFTDADCTHHPQWLENYENTFSQKGKSLFFGPVVYETNSFIENIFSLEFLSLMGTGMGLAGAGMPVYMNGANYAISRDLLYAHKTKDGADFVSGDDVFLLHHVKKTYGSSHIFPIKNEKALVKTPSPRTLKQFFKQRIRWGGKTTGYKDFTTILLAGLIFGVSALQIISLLMISIFPLFLIVWILKIALDFFILFVYVKVWNQKQFYTSFLVLAPLYPFYIVVTVALGLFAKKNKW